MGTEEERYRQKLEEISEARRNRFRILVCIDGSDESYLGLRYAERMGGHREDCDIVLLYVRPIDQGLHSGGLQLRVARENMLNWGLELPGIQRISTPSLCAGWPSPTRDTTSAIPPSQTSLWRACLTRSMAEPGRS